MARQRSSNEALAEPLGPVPSARQRGDWSARMRTDAAESRRYSRFVTIMKRALPMAAVALLAAVLAYSLQPRQQAGEHMAITFERWGIDKNDLAMIKPRLTGADAQGNPFVVTADEGIQDRQNEKRAHLKNVEGDLTLKGGSWINATASRGYLDASANTMALNGAISVFSDNGYELHTTAAYVDIGKGIVTGSNPVSGQGPIGTYRADRFKIDRDAKQVFLYGNVHMTIDGREKKGT
jgi:lipopolysaccharide export system protein LptC